jgi:Phospholipid methyltransferase
MSAASAKWVRWRVRLAYPLALVCIYFAKPTRTSMIEGAIVALFGLTVRGAAAGVVHKGERLATSGIYAWSRNPLYLGSTILAIGCAIAAHSWLVFAVVAGYLAVFYPAVILKEEVYLRDRFGVEFDAYKARVPVFMPWPCGQTSEGSGFSWEGYTRNHELRAAGGALAAFGLLILRMWLHS